MNWHKYEHEVEVKNNCIVEETYLKTWVIYLSKSCWNSYQQTDFQTGRHEYIIN